MNSQAREALGQRLDVRLTEPRDMRVVTRARA